MADSYISLWTPRGMVKVATDEVADPSFGALHTLKLLGGGGGGPSSEVDVTDRMARLLGHVIVDNHADFPGGGGSSGGLTDTELRASPVVVDVFDWPASWAINNFPASFGSVQSGAWNVGVNNFPAAFQVSNFPASQAVTGPLTDAQLRAAAVPVSGPLTDAQLRASGVPVTHGGLTDAQLRATAVPVSGPLTDIQLRAAAVPVSGTFWQATQPVSAAALPLPAGASTEATLSGLSGKLPATIGQKALAASLAVVLASDQPTVPVSMAAAAAVFKGRASSFNTPGRAGTAGQKVLSLYNTGTPSVYVTKVLIDFLCTVVKAITVPPPIIRLYKVTVAPTNGTVLTKNKIGGSGSSDAGVVVRGDASADNTGSATTLTATLPAGAIITQEFAPRFITAAGYEMADRIEFLGDTEVEVKTNEGVVLHLDYTLATQNPTTDRWISGLEWRE